MIARFEASGTHIKNGFLKVRIDLIPEVGDSTYASQHVQIPDFTGQTYPGALNPDGSPVDPVAYQAWVNSLPKIWVINPCLCHFICIPQDTTLKNLKSLIQSYFGIQSLRQIQDLLITNNIQGLSAFMNTKLGSKVPVTGDVSNLIATINSRFGGMEIRL